MYQRQKLAARVEEELLADTIVYKADAPDHPSGVEEDLSRLQKQESRKNRLDRATADDETGRDGEPEQGHDRPEGRGKKLTDPDGK